MINREREAMDKQLPDGATLSTEVADCAAFFCTTLANLNEISLAQMRGLLDIALIAVSVASNLSSFEPDESGKIDQLDKLAGQLRSTAEHLRQSYSSQEAKSAAETPSAAANSESFCKKVEAALNIAMQNSSSLQQQLNTLGQAILAQSASLLFSAASSAKSEVQGEQRISK